MTSLLSNQEMIDAVLSRDASFDGEFYFGVLSTKIFCIPSCKARKPLEKNLIFFKSQKDALNAGYRGCQRCYAEFFPDSTPPWFKSMVSYIKASGYSKIDEEELSNIAGVDISTIRRLFKTIYGIPPITFHRRIRLKNALKLLMEDLPISKAAKKCGFKSISGFREAFTKEYGLPPRKYLISLKNKRKEIEWTNC